jgi:hypothetical protein
MVCGLSTMHYSLSTPNPQTLNLTASPQGRRNVRNALRPWRLLRALAFKPRGQQLSTLNLELSTLGPTS